MHSGPRHPSSLLPCRLPSAGSRGPEGHCQSPASLAGGTGHAPSRVSLLRRPEMTSVRHPPPGLRDARKLAKLPCGACEGLRMSIELVHCVKQVGLPGVAGVPQSSGAWTGQGGGREGQALC